MGAVTGSVLDQLLVRIAEASDFNPNAHVAPVALLWPDEAEQWGGTIARIRERSPVVSLGEYDPESLTGPAYWVRCVIAGTIEADLGHRCPIIYLPGVGRSALRAVEGCAPELAPIAELQYRSQWFSHPNGRDWTVRSFLMHSERGFGLAVADDAETTAVMRSGFEHTLDLGMDRLVGQLLDADFFRDLINPDPMSALLGWLDDPNGFRERFDATQWAALVEQCRADYGFDPASDGELAGAQRLGMRQGPWAHVWKRFAEQPARYPGIPDRLRAARPMELSFELDEAWPQDNERAEESLVSELLALAEQPASTVRARILELEEMHQTRRASVWADLGEAPMAFAVEQLASLAQLTTKQLSGADVPALVAQYAESGWRVDDAALRVLEAVPRVGERTPASAAAAALYRPWIESAADALQAAIGPLANSGTYEPKQAELGDPGTVTVFVDGLRLDVAHRITDRLASIGLDLTFDVELAALPTVTETAKAALVPLPRDQLIAGPDLHAANASTGTKATVQVLRALMAERGIQVLGQGDSGDPSGLAWTEVGRIDHQGHDVGSRLVDYLDQEVEHVVVRVRDLLEAGWESVEIVTDHGWILLAGGLEKIDLPIATTEVRKGRCARLKDGAHVDVPTVPWFWDPTVRIALAPGVRCFEANKEFEHGGVSPQECIVPRVRVTAGAMAVSSGGPDILKVKWLGLLCRIELTGASEGVVVDLRALAGDPTTSIAVEAKETRGDGRVSLVVPDEDHEGERVHLVVVTPDGSIVAQRELVVGRNR